MGSPHRIDFLHTLCRNRRFNDAIAVASRMDGAGVAIPRDVIYQILQGCSKDLQSARKIHALIVSNRLDKVSVLADHLIRLFVSCGSLADAEHVFSRILKPSVYTWNAIITAHAKLGDEESVFDLFHRMQQQGIKPDRVTSLCLLKVCGHAEAIRDGRLIHNDICQHSHREDVVLQSALIDMYAKSGAVCDARGIFDMSTFRDVIMWGAMVAGYAQHGSGITAIWLFLRMQDECIQPNDVVFSAVLAACSNIGAIENGWLLHSQIIESSLESDLVIRGSLVGMYSKCGELEDAETVLKSSTNDIDEMMWGSIISGYINKNEHQRACTAFITMLLEGMQPTNSIMLSVLKAANVLQDIRWGMLLHQLLTTMSLELELMVINAVIDMYAKCGHLMEAKHSFDGMRERDIISWAALMGGYSQYGDLPSITALWVKMENDGFSPDRAVILCLLKSCSLSNNALYGMFVHDQIEKCLVELDLLLGNALIDMYSKCGSLLEARAVFDSLQERDDISWSTIISGYAHCEDGCAAISLFTDMLQAGIETGKAVLISMLKACSNIRGLFEGRLLHELVVRNSLTFDLDIAVVLIHLYSDSGSIEDAIQVFYELPVHDMITFEAIICVVAKHRDNDLAVELFEKMQHEGFEVSEEILFSVVEACGGIGSILHGRMIHHQILKCGLESNVSVGNFLIGMYMEWCNHLEARKVFDALNHKNETSWGIMLAGHLFQQNELTVMEFFTDEVEFISGRQVFVYMLKACSRMKSVEQGQLLHFQIIGTGFEMDFVVVNALIDMYIKCESLHEASIIFDKLPVHDLVMYSTMMAGFMEHNELIPALELYGDLQKEGLSPDKDVFQCILRICGSLGAITQGMQAHNAILIENIESEQGITGALVDMYVNTALLEEGHKILDSVSCPDLMSWGAILAGNAQLGNYEQVIQSLQHMKRQGIKPTERMFSSILSACSHAGSLNGGYQCFKSMIEEYDIIPTREHLNCMADLFGRLGCLHEAVDFLKAMPTDSDIVAWRSLLAGCHTYGNTKLGAGCFDQVVKLQPDNGSGYVLMSSTYAETEMREDDVFRESSKVYVAPENRGSHLQCYQGYRELGGSNMDNMMYIKNNGYEGVIPFGEKNFQLHGTHESNCFQMDRNFQLFYVRIVHSLFFKFWLVGELVVSPMYIM